MGRIFNICVVKKYGSQNDKNAYYTVGKAFENIPSDSSKPVSISLQIGPALIVSSATDIVLFEAEPKKQTGDANSHTVDDEIPF